VRRALVHAGASCASRHNPGRHPFYLVGVDASLSDKRALRRIRRDPDAICVLYDRYAARLVAELTRRAGDREVAWELTQETFARVLEHGHRLRLEGEASAWPWLLTVARNLARDWHRRGAVDSSARARLGIASRAYVADSSDDLIARLDAATLAGPLERALEALPPTHRHAVAGRVTEELSYDELAAAQGTSEQVVRARVSRGLRAMRVRLSEVRS
jgi:RNA polymerase sigma factor (sigma-70 family)